MNMMWTSKVDTCRGGYPCLPGEGGGGNDSGGDSQGVKRLITCVEEVLGERVLFCCNHGIAGRFASGSRDHTACRFFADGISLLVTVLAHGLALAIILGSLSKDTAHQRRQDSFPPP